MKIAVVGVCASGKSTLARALREIGVVVVEVAQEHSHVQHMWQAITKPDVLIFLDASEATVRARWPYKGDVDFVAEQNRRLTHARTHAQLVICVDELNAQQVLGRAVAYLAERCRNNEVVP
jgi:deoxyadenosine/deoxycytidine kinase